MKRILYKASIVLPLMMIIYISVSPFSICIPEIGLFMENPISRFLIIMLTIVWLRYSPFKKSCCNGSITELLFYLVPEELVLFVIFAQWHFKISFILILLLITGEIFLHIFLKNDEFKRKKTKKRHKRYQSAFRRITVLALTVVCFVPSCMTIFKYRLQTPEDKAEYQTSDQLPEYSFTASREANSDEIYSKNSDLWHCFEEKRWEVLSIDEKITVMQRLVDFEAEVLGIPTIPVYTKKMGYLLGAYDYEAHEIWIDTKHLSNSSVEEGIKTLCHEMCHAMQWWLVNTIDWDNPAMQTAYFKELQNWAVNQKNYKDAWRYGYKEYENQPLEVTAREYGALECERIMKYVLGNSAQQ